MNWLPFEMINLFDDNAQTVDSIINTWLVLVYSEITQFRVIIFAVTELELVDLIPIWKTYPFLKLASIDISPSWFPIILYMVTSTLTLLSTYRTYQVVSVLSFTHF